MTIEQLEDRIKDAENKIKALNLVYDRLSATVESKTNSSDLNRTSTELRELIAGTDNTVAQLNEKLSKVILPEETRYYLKEGEVAAFQSNFNKLKTMLIKIESLYQSVVAYESKRVE